LVQRLHFSLAEGGYMALGKVEMLLGRGELFEPLDVKRRIFRKITPSTLRGRLLAMSGHGQPRLSLEATERALDAAFENAADAQVVLDGQGNLLAINARARTLFGIPPETVGRPFRDLEISYRPIELRSSIDQARAEGRPIRLNEVARWTPAGELTFLDISVAPLGVEGEYLGVAITFVDVSAHRQLQQDLEHTHRALEVAYEELQSANEELETTNEELQSTIEELETTNEELQSTNEELETMNEELSSTNQELHAINDELRDRTAEVDQVNAYLESVLTGLHSSIIVVDPKLCVRVWNGLAFEMWGLRAEEVEGRPFFGVDIGFPVERLRVQLLSTLAGDPPADAVVTDARSRRGHPIRCVARVTRLAGASGKTEGAIIIIEELEPT
jgi:two-component system CheB/CheR fusion protein